MHSAGAPGKSREGNEQRKKILSSFAMSAIGPKLPESVLAAAACTTLRISEMRKRLQARAGM
jgi:hypothetical protein